MPVLTRRDLYELVWSKPITKLAEDFGLSDVGLAKICERHRVPTPPRGYWARKEAGQKVKQTIFVQVDDAQLDRVEIHSSRHELPEPVRIVVERQRKERAERLRPARPQQATPVSISPVEELHPEIRATAKALRRSKGAEAEAKGDGMCGVTVGTRTVERVISVLDQLARACECRGLAVTAAGTCVAVSVGADTVRFSITEKTKRVPHVLTEEEIAAQAKRDRLTQRIVRPDEYWRLRDTFGPLPPALDTLWTGELGLEVTRWCDGLRRNWRDGKTQTLETLIPDIVNGLEAHVASERDRREAQERAEAARRELERRRALAKARHERERNREALLIQLMRMERRAAALRAWISANAALASLDDPDLARFFTWAQSRLAEMEGKLDPAGIAADLRTRRLFPEIDELHDPLGDLPPERRWY